MATCQTLSKVPLRARSDDAKSFLFCPVPTQESLEFGVSLIKDAEMDAGGGGR